MWPLGHIFYTWRLAFKVSAIILKSHLHGYQLPAAGFRASTAVTRCKFIPESSAMTSMSWTVTAALTPDILSLRFGFIRGREKAYYDPIYMNALKCIDTR